MQKDSVVILVSFVAFVIAAILLFVGNFGSELKVSFTEAELQTKLTEALAKYPAEKFKVEKLTVELHERDASVSALASGTYLGKEVCATLDLRGSPDYQKGSFYFAPSGLPKVTVTFVQPETAAQPEPNAFSRTKKLLAEKLEQVIQEQELTELAQTFKEELALWFQGKTEVVVLEAFKRHPLYTLPPNTTGALVQASLKEVVVTGGVLVATLSITTLAWYVIVAVVFASLVISGGVAFIRHASNPQHRSPS